MVQIKCLSNGLYSLKNSHIPFGMGFQPPLPLTAEFRLNSPYATQGLPLIACGQNYFLRSVLERVWSEVGETVRSRYRARAGSRTNVTDATISSHMKEGKEITFSTNMRLERH